MYGQERRRRAIALLTAERWLALATVSESAVPSISYVPFAPVDGTVGIVVSRMAPHTANLLARRPASIMFVDESDAGDAYARVRLSVDVTAKPHPAGSNEAAAIWSALESRQGGTVKLLRTLPDFEAVALEPGLGRLILGFAAAHDLSQAAVADLLRSSS